MEIRNKKKKNKKTEKLSSQFFNRLKQQNQSK